MAGLLGPYLRDQARRAFVWGAADCGLFVADWVHLVTGIDPAPEVRGAYHCRRTAARVARGGLGATVARFAARAGMVEPDGEVAPGSIAIAIGQRGAACTIRTPTGWAMRDERRLYVTPLDAAAIGRRWSFPDAHG